jgi:2-oxopent-4-enoate/cis-2-oxohex-4-enoate hydratase
MSGAMDQSRVDQHGDALYDALVSRRPLPPLTEREPEVSIEDAYRIQLRLVQRRLDAGERVIGKKIGVTSPVVMAMLKVDQPDFGHLLSGMLSREGEPVPLGTMIAPRAEAEVAFVLRRDLRGPGIDAADVLAATEYVTPCLEIVDSRIRDWQIKIQDTVADNASCGALVLGPERADPGSLDLAAAEMRLYRNGTLVSTGSGSMVQGSPPNAVAWLANMLGRLGVGLKAGEVILSGSQSPLIPVVPGDELHCVAEGLGRASVRFV